MTARDTSLASDHKTPGARPTTTQRGERHKPKSGALAVTGLLLLSVLPVFGGVLRLE